jgi:hypothetical protein
LRSYLTLDIGTQPKTGIIKTYWMKNVLNALLYVN